MNIFWEIIKDEFKTFINDKGVMLIMIVGVVLYSIFYSIPYSSEVIKDVPIAVMDLDNSFYSREFLQKLDSTDAIKIKLKSENLEKIQKEFFKSNIKAYLIIPRDFSKNISRGKQSHISLYADSSYLIIYKQVVSGTISTAVSYGAKIEVGKLLKSGVPKQMAMALKEPFIIVDNPLFNPAGGYATYVYPIILILILHQTLLIGVGLMLGQKRELKIPYCKICKNEAMSLFARATFYVGLYLIYSIAYFLVYPLVLNYPMAYNIVPLFIFLTMMFYAVIFFAHAISCMFKSREAALLLFVVTSLVFIFLPGLIWPKESIPEIINFFAYLIPATSGIDAIIKINQMGATFIQVQKDFYILLFLCIFYFIMAVQCLKTDYSKD